MSEPYAIRIHETGGPDVLTKEPFTPKQPGPGQALVRQSAVGLNFIDTYFRTGLYPAKFPFTPGGEGAGVVESVGEGVTHLKPGDRVGYVGSGTYATHVTLPAASLLPLPDGVSEEEAAAVMLKGLTAWMLLFEIRPVKAGDTLLVWAPVGGVGSLLVPWAVSLGARVIAVTSSEKKAAMARASGASDVIVGYDNVAEQVKALTDGKGVDVALDSVGKVSFEASLRSLKPRGWMISYGNASGAVDPMPPSRLAQGGSLILTRPTLFQFIDTPERLARGAGLLFAAIKDGTLTVEIGQRFALEDAADAHRALESGKTTGATILVP
ncbi:quinone oxidoreductase family protein [Hyphomonas johnsonii]|uniref:Putative quinone oxidoreductase n=1 Tax=Hyphomonas johnsonii MHS-2 TaxID=1280950 RepID=A0A059FJR1_9PROT|nr:quinone oxidoreductase [Hyphomonas johnsonii]KCZ90869.1 putative quinone oxidoreductase [Hyphomonas johnsonii MHS-2]